VSSEFVTIGGCTELRAGALDALRLDDPTVKVAAVRVLAAADLPIDTERVIDTPPGLPGRPARPLLVPAKEVPQRAVGTPPGHAGLLHALTHIEFNAINLALDACWRFAGMPAEYYRDWLRVAAEEAEHFSLLVDHLGTQGCAYGDLPAHDGLWQMAERTGDDVLARMALVPRTLEARGLDASPQVRNKLVGIGDHAGARIIDVILRDEIGHVAVGNHWFHHLCAERDSDPVLLYEQLSQQYGAPRLRGPFNLRARRLAGFLPEELLMLPAEGDNALSGPTAASSPV
jgi:uncharacterized ferritin-like protein (DUF455 family)